MTSCVQKATEMPLKNERQFQMFGAVSTAGKAGDARRDRKKTLREDKTQVGDTRGADTEDRCWFLGKLRPSGN